MICNLIVCVARPFIDVNPYRDTKGIQNTEITWDVVSDRGYRYTIIDTSDNSVVERKYFVIHADLNNAHIYNCDCRERLSNFQLFIKINSGHMLNVRGPM